MAVLRPDLMMKNVVPVIMAGIIAIVRWSAGFEIWVCAVNQLTG
jgi:hypothetical protein